MIATGSLGVLLGTIHLSFDAGENTVKPFTIPRLVLSTQSLATAVEAFLHEQIHRAIF